MVLGPNATITMAPSEIWRHFIKVNKCSGKCKHCGSVVANAGNTRNMWNHLERRHKAIYSREKGSKQRQSVERATGEPDTDPDPDDPIPIDTVRTFKGYGA